jgi:hypothetical protein
MDGKPTIGQFVSEQLSAEKRQVARTRNSGGLAGIYPNTARAVLAEYPGNHSRTRQVVLGTLRSDADRMHVITKHDVSAGIRSAAQILGAPFQSNALRRS